MTREEEIKGRLDKATPSPWVATENHVSCPLCDGEGDVDALTLDAVGPWAVTVQVYGIGTDFKNHEAFLHHAPDDIRYLLSRNEELQRRVEKLERVANNAREAIKRHPEQVCMGIKMAMKAFDAADVPEPTPNLAPVYPGPDLKRGDIVYTPSGRRAEVYNIDEDAGTFTSQGQFCASVLRREKTAADAEEK